MRSGGQFPPMFPRARCPIAKHCHLAPRPPTGLAPHILQHHWWFRRQLLGPAAAVEPTEALLRARQRRALLVPTLGVRPLVRLRKRPATQRLLRAACSPAGQQPRSLSCTVCWRHGASCHLEQHKSPSTSRHILRRSAATAAQKWPCPALSVLMVVPARRRLRALASPAAPQSGAGTLLRVQCQIRTAWQSAPRPWQSQRSDWLGHPQSRRRNAARHGRAFLARRARGRAGSEKQRRRPARTARRVRAARRESQASRPLPALQ